MDNSNKYFSKISISNNGVTLISLVVTIIIMLILAGVSISMIVGDSGVGTKAQEAIETNTLASIRENIEMAFTYCETSYKQDWAINRKVKRTDYFNINNMNKGLNINYDSSNPNSDGVTEFYFDNDAREYYATFRKDGTSYIVTKSYDMYKPPIIVLGSLSITWTSDWKLFNKISNGDNSTCTLKYLGSEETVSFPAYIYVPEDDISYKVTALKHIAVSNKNVKTIYVPYTVKNFIEDASLGEENMGIFRDLPNLSKVILKSNVTQLPTSTFNNCPNLTSIELPTSITEIGNAAFIECSSLSTINLNELVKLNRINANAFYNCKNLKNTTGSEEGTLDLSNLSNLTYIGSKAFYGCQRLTKLNFNTNETVLVYDNAFVGTNVSTVTGKFKYYNEYHGPNSVYDPFLGTPWREANPTL